MGDRNSYLDGTFCWVDLATTDSMAAKDFYSRLLGWRFEDVPVDRGGVYSKAFLGDKKVAALYQNDFDKNSIPCWQSYISVSDVDDICKKAGSLGGALLMPVMDVMQAGRMAVIKDPSGAHVSFWQPKDHFGSERVNDASCFCWNELLTRNLALAKDFYSKLLGWQYEEQVSPDPYTVILNHAKMNGGMMQMPQEMPVHVPPYWNVYFNVSHIDDVLEKLQKLGGKVCNSIMDLPVGRMAVVEDAQGACFALIELVSVDN